MSPGWGGWSQPRNRLVGVLQAYTPGLLSEAAISVPAPGLKPRTLPALLVSSLASALPSQHGRAPGVHQPSGQRCAHHRCVHTGRPQHQVGGGAGQRPLVWLGARAECWGGALRKLSFSAGWGSRCKWQHCSQAHYHLGLLTPLLAGTTSWRCLAARRLRAWSLWRWVDASVGRLVRTAVW